MPKKRIVEVADDKDKLNPDDIGMVDLAELIDNEIDRWKCMSPSKERNELKRFISSLVTSYNKRTKYGFKEIWWH